MIRLGYYGELDPFSGLRADEWGFATALTELSFALLVYDQVIVQPNNLLEHPLTLPLFERLAPFVRAGRLGTTADRGAPPPVPYLEGRLDKARRGGARAGAEERARRRDLTAMARRFKALLPRAWSATRSVDDQVRGFGDQFRRFLSDCGPGDWLGERCGQWMADAEARGERVDRDFIFQCLARASGYAPPSRIAMFAAAAQSIYFSMGARGHQGAGPWGQQSCTLFPGRFGVLLQRPPANRPLPKSALAELPPPPFDWAHDPRALDPRWRTLGLDSRSLLALPPAELLEVATSPEWLRFRDAGELPGELAAAVAARFRERRDLRDALPKVSDELQSIVPHLGQLGAAALLGAVIDEGPAEIVLDLGRHSLRRGASVVGLSKAQARLLCLIALAGRGGLPIDRWKQAKLEMDLLEFAGAGDSAVRWRRQEEEDAGASRRRSTLLQVHKHGINRLLAGMGIRLALRHGRLGLVVERGLRLRLAGTLWDLLAPLDAAALTAGLALSPTEARLISRLAAEAAALPVAVLATALGKPDEPQARKQTSDALHALAKKLDARGAPVRLRRLHRGHYVLIPGAR